MLTQEQNETLTRTSAGTPMGECAVPGDTSIE